MSKLELKRKVLEAGKAKLQGVVNDFEDRINELKAVTVGGAGLESASQNEGRVGADIEMIGTLTDQLDFASMELDTLDRMQIDKEHMEVDFGSIVITDQRNLFVSTGIEGFEVDGVSYFGLSTQAPLYKNMAGKKAGDKLSFNGIEYNIKEVF